jgi:opacity protein-like surface antigen
MMRTALVLAFMAVAASAQAQQRPFTPRLGCGQAQQIVAANGAVVLGTGTYTYDRYVRDRTFCQHNETTEVAFIPTRDTPQCPVYRCREIELDFFD